MFQELFRRGRLADFAGLIAILLVVGNASAEVFLSDTTDGPLWERPQVTGVGTSGELVPYFALPFAVTASGSYTFTATPQDGSFDLVQFLYDATFAPATPFTGYLAGEDIFSSGGGEQFQFALSSGATYFAVTTGYAGFDYGPYVLSITGPGSVSIVDPPDYVPGDFTENHAVDVDDLTAWKNGFDDPQPATHMQGDADGDLDVDGNDFLIWQRDLGRPDATTSVTTPAPEPHAAVLLSFALLAAGSAHRNWPRRATPRRR